MGASRSKFSVLLVGLDHAGKSTILFNLRLGGDVLEDFDPTKGFNYAVIERVYSKRRFQFHFLDLAGEVHLRPLWRHFYRTAKPHVVLFVVDANNESRMPDARKEFHKLIHEVDLVNSLIMVVANVKMQKGQMKESEIRDKMDIPRQYEIVSVNAHEPQELKSAMHHICQILLK